MKRAGRKKRRRRRVEAAQRACVSLPGRMAVACCYFNPAGWRSLRRNYLRFLHEMKWWGIPVFAAEMAFRDDPFENESAVVKVRATDKNILWQKERLINMAVARMDDVYDKVCWIDADIVFLDEAWPSDVASALEQWPVVQMWDRCHGVTCHGRVGECLQSIGAKGRRYEAGATRATGVAWAARRDIFPLYDRVAFGSGDFWMVEAWLGRWRNPSGLPTSEPMRADFAEWGEAAAAKVSGSIGALRGDVIHLHHGSLKKRLYVKREEVAISMGFDPKSHLVDDTSGVLAWSSTAPEPLVAWAKEYFACRQEDEGAAPGRQE